MAHGHGLVVNLASVTFIDTAGIGVLARIWHRVRASYGSLALAVPARQVQRVLDAGGLADAFSVYDAVQACRQSPGGQLHKDIRPLSRPAGAGPAARAGPPAWHLSCTAGTSWTARPYGRQAPAAGRSVQGAEPRVPSDGWAAIV